MKKRTFIRRCDQGPLDGVFGKDGYFKNLDREAKKWLSKFVAEEVQDSGKNVPAQTRRRVWRERKRRQFDVYGSTKTTLQNLPQEQKTTPDVVYFPPIETVIDPTDALIALVDLHTEVKKLAKEARNSSPYLRKLKQKPASKRSKPKGRSE